MLNVQCPTVPCPAPSQPDLPFPLYPSYPLHAPPSFVPCFCFNNSLASRAACVKKCIFNKLSSDDSGPSERNLSIKPRERPRQIIYWNPSRGDRESEAFNGGEAEPGADLAVDLAVEDMVEAEDEAEVPDEAASAVEDDNDYAQASDGDGIGINASVRATPRRRGLEGTV